MIAIPIILKCYSRIFENFSRIKNIQQLEEAYLALDIELEYEFNEIQTVLRKNGWNFTPEIQVRLAKHLLSICNVRRELANRLDQDVDKI